MALDQAFRHVLGELYAFKISQINAFKTVSFFESTKELRFLSQMFHSRLEKMKFSFPPNEGNAYVKTWTNKRELSGIAQNFLRLAAPNMDPKVHLAVMKESTDWVAKCGSVEKSLDSCGERGDLYFAIRANKGYLGACL